MRLIDIVTPEILEKALHTPVPSDKEEAKRLTKMFIDDCDERLKATAPLAAVFMNCLRTCGSLAPVTIEHQNHIQHLCLAVIDAAIELATKEAV